MLGDTRRSRIGIIVATVAASTIASGAIVASCLEGGIAQHARMSAALSNLRSSDDDTEVVETGTTTTTAAELGVRGAAAEAPNDAARASLVVEAESTDEAPAGEQEEPRQAAPPASPSEAAVADDARAIADTLDRTVTTLERMDEARRESEADAEAEDAERDAREAYEAGRAEASAGPTAEERTARARQAAQFVAGTPMVQPRFEDIGAGAFLTEAPIWAASAMTSDPNAGAGPFTTETTMSPNIVYYGAPGGFPQGGFPQGATATPNVGVAQGAGVIAGTPAVAFPAGAGVVTPNAVPTPSPGAMVVQPSF